MSISVVNHLRQLSLSGAAAALRHQIDQPETFGSLSFEARLELLLEHELNTRSQRRQQRLIRQAGFKLQASLGGIEYRDERNLRRERIAQLAQCDWLARGQNVFVTGPCGSGKTFVACALGHNACTHGYKVLYGATARWFGELEQARLDGSYLARMGQLANTHLLIFDDFALTPLGKDACYDLMAMMDDRYAQHSTMIVSQLPPDQWYGAIGDNTLAEAILDRLMHNAHRIALEGESMRKRIALDSAMPSG